MFFPISFLNSFFTQIKNPILIIYYFETTFLIILGRLASLSMPQGRILPDIYFISRIRLSCPQAITFVQPLGAFIE